MAHGLAGGVGPLHFCPSASSSSATVRPTLYAPPRRSLRVRASAFTPPTAPAIEGRDVGFSVTKRRGKVLQVLKGCSILVPPGQLWMLLGPNGCGKSTLLKVLAGFLNPSTGTVYINRPCSYVFQNPDHQLKCTHWNHTISRLLACTTESFDQSSQELQPKTANVVMPTVESDVAFGLGKLKLPLDEVRLRVSKSLDAVGMLSYSQRPIQTLSGGQKQRVAIAGALAEASKVLLLDELTTFLDEHDQMGVVKAVKNSVAADGEVAALWVTHRLEELKYADGAIYMEDGQIIIQGDVSTISRFIKRKQARYFGHFEL